MRDSQVKSAVWAAYLLSRCVDMASWPAGSVATIMATTANFAASVAGDNSSYYDPYWSVAPPLLMAYFHVIRNGSVPALREMLVALVVAVWSVRLTSNCMAPWHSLWKPHREDWRYAEWRSSRLYWVVSFAGFHAMPSLLTWYARAAARAV